jgi:cytochrome P450
VHWNALKITLHVFFAAGFGHPFEWEGSDDVWQGHTLSPVGAISTVVDHLLAYLFIPKRILNLPVAYFKKIMTAYNEAGQYYREFIELEKKGLLAKAGGAKTVLGQLVSNSFYDTEGETDDERLTDEEIIGNIFIFIVAGYETSYKPSLDFSKSLQVSNSFLVLTL